MPLRNRQNRNHIEGSEHSASLSSSQSKSIDSSDELSISSPEFDTKHTISESYSSIRSSVPDSPCSNVHTSEYPLKFVGLLDNLERQVGGSLDIINIIDIAQMEEEICLIPNDDEVLMSLSTYGVVVTASNQRDVISRIPLYKIERLVTFNDGVLGSTMLALKVVQMPDNLNKESTFSLHIYQCINEVTGQKIARTFSHILDTVLSTPVTTDASSDAMDETVSS